MAKTAIVILNWNGVSYLEKFLGLVVEHSASADIEIVLADNGSTDGSADWVEKNFADVRVIRLDKNYGFAGGYNLALAQVEATYYILLNSDIEVTPEWTKPLITFMDNNPNAAAVQPKILSWHNREYFEYAGAAGGYIDKFGYPFCRGRIFNNVEKDTGQYDSGKEIFWSSGACMIISAEVWKKCSGFDADFFAHMEEIDLCWRFHKAGYKVFFIHESVVYHVGGGMLAYNSPFKTYLNFRNNLFLLYKNLPQTTRHKTLFIRKLLDGLAAVNYLFSGKFSNIHAILKAHIDYYKSTDNLKKKRESVKKLTVTDYSEGVLNKSLVFEFYIKRRKTFDKLKLISDQE
jgi:GT2 family glycosyltransferase